MNTEISNIKQRLIPNSEEWRQYWEQKAIDYREKNKIKKAESDRLRYIEKKEEIKDIYFNLVYKNDKYKVWYSSKQELDDIYQLNDVTIENKYNGHYLGEFCLRDIHGNWANQSTSVFYTPIIEKPEYSNYF